jgi:hypothetical protein
MVLVSLSKFEPAGTFRVTVECLRQIARYRLVVLFSCCSFPGSSLRREESSTLHSAKVTNLFLCLVSL